MTPQVKGKIVYQCDTADEWVAALSTLLHSDVAKFNPELDEVFKSRFSYEAMLEDFKACLPPIHAVASALQE